MIRSAMIRVALITNTILAVPAFGGDTGTPDILRLEVTRRENGESIVAVHILNDQRLTALDIPLRFGRPGDSIELLRVDFTERVGHWDVTHAQIDNESKTVILGLIAVLGRMDQSADLDIASAGNTLIANLVFRIRDRCEPTFATFTTREPNRELAFLYYRYGSGEALVESYTPMLEVRQFAPKISALPVAFGLSPNVPNPFNATTKFTISLPEASSYEIRIYNVAGQLVRTYEGHSQAGEHAFTWDGSNDYGSQVASGVYFCRAKAGHLSETRMMMLLR